MAGNYRDQSSDDDEEVEINRRRRTDTDEEGVINRRRRPDTDEVVEINRRHRSDFNKEVQINRRRRSDTDEEVEINRRRSDTDEEVEINRRRRSDTDEEVEINRRRRSDTGKEVEINRRRRSDTDSQSDEEQNSIFSNYGWIYVEKITNNSDKNVHFFNPYLPRSGHIDPGESDTSDSTGYLPLWSYRKKYELEYHNTVLDEKKKIEIKDLEGDWLASFYQDENEEDIRDVTPKTGKAFLTIVITNNGYEVYESGRMKGGICWQSD